MTYRKGKISEEKVDLLLEISVDVTITTDGKITDVVDGHTKPVSVKKLQDFYIKHKKLPDPSSFNPQKPPLKRRL